MKQLLTIAAASLLLAACAPKEAIIEVTNNCDFARHGELVSMPIPNDIAKLGKIIDQNGKEVPFQITLDGHLLFQADVEAQATATYQLKTDSRMTSITPKTTAFFLGDRRKDDFCWENDKAAYRMYGPALLPENPSSGVDLWLKHSEELTADAMYRQEEGGKPYHVDYGLGIDSYKVGHAAGCGGIALVAGGEIWPGGPFASWKIIESGPLQTVFELTYDSVQVQNHVLKELIRITVNAGSQVNKAEVTLMGEDVEGLEVGGAIFLHEEMGNLTRGFETYNQQHVSYLSYCEDATSDKGIYRIHEQQGIDAKTLDFGRNYVAVLLPGMHDSKTYGITEALTQPYKVGETYTYYFGGGWSKRDYTTDEAWNEATAHTAMSLLSPLEVYLRTK